VAANVPGHSFADIGGMWKYMGDMSFHAEEHGATRVTLFDVGDPDLPAQRHPEWGSFAEKARDRGSKVRHVQGDFEDLVSVDRIGLHDVVFYSGVLYHTPNPFLQLTHLRRITRKLAFVSSITIPEIPGFPQACIWFPYLDEKERRPYARGFGELAKGLGTVEGPFIEEPMQGYANTWFGMTPSALRSMLEAARFEVVSERTQYWTPYITDYVVRPIDKHPSLPPPDYFRLRGEARKRGEEPPYSDWYDVHGSAAPEPSDT
jgi:hypothetical protein